MVGRLDKCMNAQVAQVFLIKRMVSVHIKLCVCVIISHGVQLLELGEMYLSNCIDHRQVAEPHGPEQVKDLRDVCVWRHCVWTWVHVRSHILW